MPIPPFPRYFSGAPVVYPPVGAAADSIGGLAGARVLSLVFMLGATVLLWGAAARQFGRRAAFFAAALFAVLGTTVHLEAFATYDAMSVFLVALAAWCVIRAGARGPATDAMVAAAAILALANATAYASLLFDPLIAALALLTAPWTVRGLLAARRAGTVLAVTAVLLAAGLRAGGGSYLGGFERTMLTRVPHSAARCRCSASPGPGPACCWSWPSAASSSAGPAGAAPRRQRCSRSCPPPWRSGPLEQAHLHTEASLNHHVGLGAWFTVIAAGYAVDRFHRGRAGGPRRELRGVRDRAGLPGLARHYPVPGLLRQLAERIRLHRDLRSPGRPQHRAPPGRESLRRRVPARRRPVAAVVQHPQHHAARRHLHRRPGRRQRHQPRQRPVYANYIAEGYFSLVALNFTNTTGPERQIAVDLRRNHHYHIIQVVPYGIEVPPIGQGTYIIWQYPARTRQAGYTPDSEPGRGSISLMALSHFRG